MEKGFKTMTTALGEELVNESVTDIDNQLRQLQKLIRQAGEEYYEVAKHLGALTANRYIAEAEEVLRLHDLEGWEGHPRLTVDVRKASSIMKPKVQDAIREYYITRETAKAAKGKLEALQNELSAVQTRAGLIKTEVSLIKYQ